MKKIILAVVIVAITVICLTGCMGTDRSQYIRIHIRANSDAEIDQSVKLEVRDEVVAFLTPLAGSAKNKAEMEQIIRDNREKIVAKAQEVLERNGFTYGATADLTHEDFPEKTYGDLTLDAGDYDALVVRLGSGNGANWWCVAYPPLCFLAGEDNGTDEVAYKSIIAEWFRNN